MIKSKACGIRLWGFEFCGKGFSDGEKGRIGKMVGDGWDFIGNCGWERNCFFMAIDGYCAYKNEHDKTQTLYQSLKCKGAT